MNKLRKLFVGIFPLCLCCFSGFSVSAHNIGSNLYRVCKNDIFIDYEQQNTKKIITEVKQNGCFIAEDLGVWIEKQNFYNITEIEGDICKKIFYESDSVVQEETNCVSDEVSYIYFTTLVEAGDIIRCTDSWIERVTDVKSDGSFYTEIEEVPEFLSDETE